MNEAKLEKKQVPLRPGLFKIPEEAGAKPYIVASKCRNCDEHFFPTRLICLKCGKEQMEEVALAGRGKVATHTTVMQQVPGSLVVPPYDLAIITMDEGCQVQTIVTEDAESIRIGMPMEVYFEKIREDADGNEEIVYKFRQAKE